MAEEGDLWVIADPWRGHTDGELVILVKPTKSDPPARPKERYSEAEKLCVG
jgi:hypothetical protein